MAPAHVCLVTVRAPCHLVIRSSTSGVAVAWPMLAAVPCPYSDPWAPRRHGHVHFMTEAGPPWYRIAPCNRQPYLLEIAA